MHIYSSKFAVFSSGTVWTMIIKNSWDSYCQTKIAMGLLVGGLNPSEKYESQLGWLFPIYGKIKLMATKPPTRFTTLKSRSPPVTPGDSPRSGSPPAASPHAAAPGELHVLPGPVAARAQLPAVSLGPKRRSSKGNEVLDVFIFPRSTIYWIGSIHVDLVG